MLLSAHFGHVLVDLPIFFGPFAVLGGWMALTARRDRRRRAAAGSVGRVEAGLAAGSVGLPSDPGGAVTSPKADDRTVRVDMRA